MPTRLLPVLGGAPGSRPPPSGCSRGAGSLETQLIQVSPMGHLDHDSDAAESGLGGQRCPLPCLWSDLLCGCPSHSWAPQPGAGAGEWRENIGLAEKFTWNFPVRCYRKTHTNFLANPIAKDNPLSFPPPSTSVSFPPTALGWNCFRTSKVCSRLCVDHSKGELKPSFQP